MINVLYHVMNIFEAIKTRILPKDKGNAYVTIPTSLGLSEEDDLNREDQMKMYRSFYDNVPLMNAIINVQADQVTQEFFFKGPNEKSLAKWADIINLMQFFHQLTRNLLIYGNSWVEVIRKGGDIIDLKFLPSESIEVYRTNIGKVTGYGQIMGGKHLILWGTTGNESVDNKFIKKISKLENIIHFKFNFLGSEKYGVSVIQNLISSLNSKIHMEKSLGKLLDKYIAPLIWAKVGSDEMPAQASVVNDVASELRDLHSESEIVTSHLVDLNVLQFDKKGIDIKTPLDHIDQQIVTGGEVPSILLGRETGVDKAAEVQLRNFGRRIKSIQRVIKIEFEDKVIVGQQLGTFEDKLIWERAEEREWESDVDIIRGLVTDGILTAQKGNSLLPPKFQEVLPEIEPLNQQEVEDGVQKPRPNQMKNDKVKDNPTDPTKTTKNPKSHGRRVTKTDKEIPIK